MLNITAEQRLAQLKLNYDRLRGLMNGIEERYVLVNVPAFQLEAVDKFEVQLRHRVIVGRPGRETPDVAHDDQGAQLLPLLARARQRRHARSHSASAQGAGLSRRGRHPRLQRRQRTGTRSQHGRLVFAADRQIYKFKQDPGEKNALGLLRLDMSNQYGVYMHDTPMKNLFDQRSRAFSAGCVRVQNVFDLGDWIAHYEPGWEQPGRVRQQLDTGQPMELKLTRPIPVYFTYITAWAEPSTGSIEFRPDIYGRDGSAMQTSYQHDADDAPPASAAAALAP